MRRKENGLKHTLSKNVMVVFNILYYNFKKNEREKWTGGDREKRGNKPDTRQNKPGNKEDPEE